MPDRPKPAQEPTTAELLAERSAQDAAAASRVRSQARIADDRERKGAVGPDQPADTTDMSAVGDDGQVFGG